MFDNILVVCAGNICRSPIAEVMLKRELPAKNISSAGIIAKDGMPADESSVSVSADGGLDLSGHKARRLSSKLCSQVDLILVMEPKHVQDVTQRYPQASGKTMLIGRWNGVDEIPDPYKLSIEAFEHVYQLLDQACLAWAKKLK